MKKLLSETLDIDGDYYFRFALRMLGNREEAEDAVQDTFMAALTNLEAFKSKASIKTWLPSILKHKCIDRLRAHCSKRKYVVSGGINERSPTPIAPPYRSRRIFSRGSV